MANKSKSNKKYWVGFDLGGTKMLAHVYDGSYQSKGLDRRKTKGDLGQKGGMDRVIDTIETALKNADVNPKRLGGIGIGVPGPVDLD